MDRKRIVEYITKSTKYTKEQNQLIESIEEARKELFRARQYFEAADEEHLIDYAIYMEQAAKSRYIYLLDKAKENGLKIDNSFYLSEVDVG